MGIDLGLQCLDLGFLRSLLLQVGLLKLVLQLCGHGVKIGKKPIKFCVGGALLNLAAPVPGLNLAVRLCQGLHGRGDVPPEQPNHHQQQRQHHQCHTGHGPAQPGRILPQIVALGVGTQSDGVSVRVNALLDFPIFPGRFITGQLRDNAIVYGEGQTADPVDALQALQQDGAVQQHRNGGIGLEAAVQHVPGHV